jgi:3-methylcrotonyl-CoA carboxylase alpha subunit
VLHAQTSGETFVAKVSGHAVDVSRDGDEGPPITVETQYLGHGRVALRRDGVTRVAWVVEDGDTRWVHCDGEVSLVEISEGAARRARARHVHADGPPTLVAPMPATVVRVAATPGSPVQKGAVVLILEAMKMELPLRAPHDGLVKAVHCREGDLVQPGVVLVEME